MMRCGVVLIALFLCLGCDSQPYPRSDLDQQMFGPANVRIHPTFTVVRDWTGDGKPDGIEATLEIEDQFGDPTRATGRAMFELYDYRKESPEVRGRRIGGPWIIYLNTKGQQEDHWNAALRAYTFQLPYAQVGTNRYYVLTVQFDLNSQLTTTQPTTSPESTTTAAAQRGRLFDQLIIEPEGEEGGHGGHHRASTRTPGH
jgi:hypothetical protein